MGDDEEDTSCPNNDTQHTRTQNRDVLSFPRTWDFCTFPGELHGFLLYKAPCLFDLIFSFFSVHIPTHLKHTTRCTFGKQASASSHPLSIPSFLARWSLGADFLGPAQHWLLHLSLAGLKLFKHGESRYFPRQLLHMWQGLRFNKGFQKQPSASELCKTLLYKKLASPSQRALLASSVTLFLFIPAIKHFAPNSTRHYVRAEWSCYETRVFRETIFFLPQPLFLQTNRRFTVINAI